MDEEKILSDIKWVDEFIEHLRRTKHPRDIRQSIRILEKRKAALIEKLHNKYELD